MSEVEVYEDGDRIEVDLNNSGEWVPAVVVNYHKDNHSYDIMLLETNVSKTNIAGDVIRRMIDDDPSSPRSPRTAEKVQRMDSVDEYPAMTAEADDDNKEASRSNTPAEPSRSNTPARDVASRSNSVEKVEVDDKKRKNRLSPSPERPKHDDRAKEKEKPMFDYRPQRSKIPFDITSMTYEQYCAKHYQYHIERYQADRAAGLIPPHHPSAAPLYYGGVPPPLPGGPGAPPAHLMMPPPSAVPLHYHHQPAYPYGQPPIPTYVPGAAVGYPPRGYGGAY